MENKKINLLKMIVSCVFAFAILGAYAYHIWKGEPFDRPYLYYGAVGLCMLFSLLFVKSNIKKILITLALMLTVVADYFLVFNATDANKAIGLYVFCGVQFVYLIYSLVITKNNFARALNFGSRAGLSVAAILILPRYLTLTTMQIVAVIYIINALITLITLAVHMKTEWLTFIGFLLFMICDVAIGLTNGGAEIIGISGGLIDFLNTYDIAFFCYIPGLFLISLSSVWAKNTNKND